MSKIIHKDSLPGPPVDFSFKCINSMEDVLLEDPRMGLKAMKCCESGLLLSQAVRLNNNTLTDLNGFEEMINKLLSDPRQLSWIDLSFNDVSTIDPVLTTYSNLTVLNLHGNSISKLSEVDKLAALPNLKTLTLHGNPIEGEKGYRSYVLSVLPHLKSFDFSGVTKQDRVTAEVWRRMNVRPKRAKRIKDE
ncbi:leucine-rich repeat-containing protein 51 [Ascaphus truei]|uniref:leucine-rich repeat-containing protein 51 n=1 Tax=Ascaphus truei TaxID=8439 RepID=UPI003F596527